MMDYHEFAKTITVPTLERVFADDPEPDHSLRIRVLKVCATRDRMLVAVSYGHTLDAIARLHGICRGGFRYTGEFA